MKHEDYNLLIKLASERLAEFLADIASEHSEWLEVHWMDREFALALYRVTAEQADEADEGALIDLFISARQEELVSAAERNREWFDESRSEIVTAIYGDDDHATVETE